eukprot:scaffold1277_cov253-Pinguiococcus_pyrenoidosus.AAC.23
MACHDTNDAGVLRPGDRPGDRDSHGGALRRGFLAAQRLCHPDAILGGLHPRHGLPDPRRHRSLRCPRRWKPSFERVHRYRGWASGGDTEDPWATLTKIPLGKTGSGAQEALDANDLRRYVDPPVAHADRSAPGRVHPRGASDGLLNAASCDSPRAAAHRHRRCCEKCDSQ